MKLQICLFLGVTFFSVSTADFSPPVVNISLDVPAFQRWAPLKNIYDINFLRKAASEVIDSTVPKWVHVAVKPIVEALEKYIPQPYAGEIQGMASFYGTDISDIVLLNFAYEVSAFCTSIVTQDTKGNIFHGRNLDYPHDVLKNLTLDVHFMKNGKVAYRGTTFAGYVGLWTGQSPNKFTVSGNERNKGHWWENVISAVLLKSSPVSWLIRETLEAAVDFQDAVVRLAKVPIITDVYYILGGVNAGEGVVVTRDRGGSADIWPLDPLNGKITVYTTVMSAATPEKYTTVVRDYSDSGKNLRHVLLKAMKAAVLIQRWYRQYAARMEMRRRYTWNIFQSMEYADLQDQMKLYNFLGYLMDNFTPSSSERNLISHIFRENEVCRDAEWERYFSYINIDVPDIYSGPRLTFPLDMDQVADLVEAFKNKQNGMPSMEKPYVFNGDFVDRGKDSIEILLILFAFLLVYPGDVYLNRGNHEDHIINLRYGFTKEVLGKYKLHGKRILKLLQKIFSWLPLVTVIDHRVLIVHGGISDTTDLALIARVDRHKYVSALKPPRKKTPSRSSLYADSERFDEMNICKNRRGSMTFPRPLGARESFQRRSLQDFSRTVARTAEEEFEVRRRQAEFSMSSFSKSHRILGSAPSTESEPDSSEIIDTGSDDWKQILDLLWSDPMSQDGCVPNEVRGGGCYWGPDITEDFLNRHNLQLIIRSHECKQDGYEFCHNRKVLTLFSASNYYQIGSNRGAFVRLGPDLVPYFVQYQATTLIRGLSFRQSLKRTEHNALKVLREQLFVHKSDLLSAFQELDKENTGLICLSDWASVIERVLQLDLPWRVLQPQLVSSTTDGMLDYHGWFRDLALKRPSSECIEQSMLETLYKHRSTLETIFRIVDTDNSGLISFEDFRQTLKLLSAYLKMEISDEVINELVISTDTNNDGSIDIDEFMEAFQLVDKIRIERGKSQLKFKQEYQNLPLEEKTSPSADSTGPQISQCSASRTEDSPGSHTEDCSSSQTQDLCDISVVVPPQ
ncbi:Serine/threonine-protein phosphatase with EF-hands 2 [Anabarilius grahami]|uniref:Serine/threonine-protein phosphatase n=1 Tax=Anabarilius grahami TaxID=495550 RepID=A0A3N0Y999_ANAGA|nr:Serine/threonine-protein phosphatase with EF-hands 2 [Anabarilius grahami]